jgi:hypothetical protein
MGLYALSSALRFVARAITRPVVQILNIIEGHLSLSSSFYKDFKEERMVVAGVQVLSNNSKRLRGRTFG